ncbi:pyruvate formate lyase-activating protein [Granulicatella sp. zg-ZJ]|uniref:pyruvate formate-lyase-activating protein n=1 Tax=unclassified Granulicatella TaxID=2630493 RepID=UPI0013BEC748|nr:MULTISPECIES: pyruvate formate-lyase-activating protein [unclassified Granulicatella]MBS4750683.1 pyruvate formate lyase-activating protein [Carnobacteriaceae bacterium zg-ZUI78]NEW63460.1 pyruvate formate lyase-activating protein [Granulicatella sp. zg-ZJ]NEW66458.1 pyruvate formate lyase-activating protein [Granulicatella sp. zg-84]QMI86339.1 pyruvate formate lyase-activating protein [Carnobacteriaceae bacterium zg-84]
MTVLGRVHSTESFGSVDGPGIRFVVFMQGCHLRCQFCHNPDTWRLGQGGREWTAEDLLNEALKYKEFWGERGGITVSGGEPLIQIDFLIEFFKLAKEKGVHTTLDSCAAPFTFDEPFFSKFNELLKYTDLILLDIKQIDDEEHKILTGRSNQNILDAATYLSEVNQPVWIRHVLVPGGSDKDELLVRLDKFVKTLKNVKRVEVLPYHKLGVYKYEVLGIPYPLKDVEPPTPDRVENANRLLHCKDYTAYLSM